MTELWMVGLTGVVGLRLSLIDLAEHRLPNRLTIPLFFSLVLVSGVGGDADSFRGAALGSVVTGLVFLGLAVMPGRPLGMGDVKLQFGLGWMLGYFALPLAILGAAGSFVVGGLSVIPTLWRNRGGGTDPVPLGPWMMVSTCLVVVGAESLKII
jgi:leader peptidase (prepilin peptidase)/N-methyltransferase